MNVIEQLKYPYIIIRRHESCLSLSHIKNSHLIFLSLCLCVCVWVCDGIKSIMVSNPIRIRGPPISAHSDFYLQQDDRWCVSYLAQLEGSWTGPSVLCSDFQQDLTGLWEVQWKQLMTLERCRCGSGPILLTDNAIIECFWSRLNESGVGKITNYYFNVLL